MDINKKDVLYDILNNEDGFECGTSLAAFEVGKILDMDIE